MKASILRDILVFESFTTERDETHALVKTWKPCFRCRAYRKKQSSLSGDELAREEFLGISVQFITRKYPQITDERRVRWNGKLWEIRMIEPGVDRLTLTLKRLDE